LFRKTLSMKRWVGVSLGVGLWGLVALSPGAPVGAETNPFVGRWHWNRTQSKLPPGETLPADMVADFSRVDPLHVRWRMTVTNAQGEQSVESFDTPANGEFYPVNADTMVAFRLGPSTLHATFKGPQGQTDELTCTVSADRQTMTCDGQMTRADGRTQSYVDVYERR
jgi:hypothetical protein